MFMDSQFWRASFTSAKYLLVQLMIACCVCSAQVDTASDRNWRYHPEFSITTGLINNDVATSLQAGFGVQFHLNACTKIAVYSIVGVTSIPDVDFQPYQSTAGSLIWSANNFKNSWKLDCVLSSSFGVFGTNFDQTAQTLAGFDFRYPLLKGNDSYNSTIEAVCITGFGRDWEFGVSQGFVNLGVAINGYVLITFDVLSAMTDQNRIIHAGRLR